MMVASKRMFSVAILVETSTSWGSRIIEGINNYVREHTTWTYAIDHRGVYEAAGLPCGWRGDGIIARVITPSIAEEIKHAGVPAVNVSWITVPNSGIPQVTVNESTVGKLACEYLLERGFTNFGYYGPPHRPHYVDRMRVTFDRAIKTAGYDSAFFDPDRFLRTGQSSHEDTKRLSKWLRSLPQPAGVLTWNTAGARRITDACHTLGIRVPDQLAVLSGDHDALMANIALPPLTCIDHAPSLVGYEAARLLDEMMAGKPKPSQPIYVEPRGIIERQSTDTLAVDDPDIAKVLNYIHTHASESIRVDDLLQIVPLSRRALEIRFSQTIGRSPAKEIRRARLKIAQRLLIETDQTITQIAEACGFIHAELLQRSFRQELQMTPSAFRQRYQSSNLNLL